MNITLEDLLKAKGPLDTIATQRGLPVKTAYRISRLVVSVNRAVGLFDKRRIELVEKYSSGTPDENGRTSVLPEKMEAFNKEVEVLLREEIDFEQYPISLDMLEQASVSAGELADLGPLLVEVDSRSNGQVEEPSRLKLVTP